MFLLNAQRMNRGMERLRFWLIMSMRMLAITTLFLALARPLTTGWLGLTLGDQAETTLVLLDRSASMEQQDPSTTRSKRNAALSQVADVLSKSARAGRIVLIDSAGKSPQEFESPELLLESLETSASATNSDMPGLFQLALDYIVANQSGRTDVWVCSDLRDSDWQSSDGRWAALRDGFAAQEGVKLYLLEYPDPARDNLAVRVENVQFRSFADRSELVFDISVTREGDETEPSAIPLEVTVNGVRSVVPIELTGQEFLLQGHQVALARETDGGWGRVELPADENSQDNISCFVFATAPVHHTTIVADDSRVSETLRLAVTAPLDSGITYTAEQLPFVRADEIDFGKTSLILWQSELPDGAVAEQLQRFVAAGKPVIFFPPQNNGGATFQGAAWGDWRTSSEEESVRVASWRGDSDLLAHAASGEPLGLGELQTFRYRELQGTTGSPLARLSDGVGLLHRLNVEEGSAYFCATLPVADHSSLAQDGLAFYALLHRALSQGAQTQSLASTVVVGTERAKAIAQWRPAAGASPTTLPSTRWLHPGAYENASERVALERPDVEDHAHILEQADVDGLLAGLDVQHVRQSVATAGALTNEIWRAILVMMTLALIVEAYLCLPGQVSPLS